MAIRLEGISKTYGEKENLVKALQNVSLEIKDGEFVAIMGTSGAGKSTLLNILGCIDGATNGKYYLDDEDISICSDAQLANIRNKKIGFVLQEYGLIGHKTVFENVEIPMLVGEKKYKSAERKKRVKEVLTVTGILSLENRKSYKLSGGQKQRVAIARALVNAPSILLADEPTGSLDQATSSEIMKELVKINTAGTTVIVVTHDEQVASYCQRIIKIEDGKIK